jgi:lipopolysaccharide transport system ATP-binding protein
MSKPQESIAIRLIDVNKEYRLYQDQSSFVIDYLGLNRLFFWKKINYIPFSALKNINLNIKKGERIGVIGRNGAGKSTLLQLITKNFAPSSGDVSVNGKIQSLMETGVGFHPDFTGMENIKASLIYNGLNSEETEKAIKDIVDFVELEDFLNQPIKTYSLGMLSRLGFATATAIKPDILIIDEVLGAGDAYFSAKCASRMKKLTRDEDTTLLLVSHATSQILQFCETCIWIENGQIQDRGPAMEIIKKYDKFILEYENKKLRESNLLKIKQVQSTPSVPTTDTSVSRWTGNTGLKITNFAILDNNKNEKYIFEINDSIEFNIQIQAEESASFPCRFHIYIFTLDGVPVSNHISDYKTLHLQKNETVSVSLNYDKLLLKTATSNGEYVLTVGVYKELDMTYPENAVFYDLLDRSFRFKVIGETRNDSSLIDHPATWNISKMTE